MKKRIFLAVLLAATMAGCGSTADQSRSELNQQIAPAIHQPTGINAPGNVDDLSRVLMTNYNEISQSSSISYGNDLMTITSSFRDPDIDANLYLDLGKQMLTQSSGVNRVLFDGSSTLVINGRELQGWSYRGYDVTKAKGDTDLHLAVLESVSVYQYGNYLVKVRSSSQSFLGGEYTDKSLVLISDKESKVLSALLASIPN
ncbi:hypothetical protein K6Y31_05980 [Motilimonas cestriensis]|uniref:Lipoprotein n=1 Tax=Motilimonas cestriensis TaxID=2742685 RepID=A0ABS8W726_9GAMM|nr:hypothetical protein [Motilimonas cestriensis]MCE2594358.1 hypothetical protein [Motilimonas cestriensis]